ncbi:hypothetical protein [Meiothermus rufus]|uniref:hypothetical protein n=1 Tax=Meiothermus rufus TaxID=604332 RepID=UPI0003F7EEDE|nr:hypothetical protein [Meiothermus rufus]
MPLAFLALFLLGSPALAQFCDQPFAPARPGWEWQYRTSGERSGAYTIRKTQITETSFVQIRQSNSGQETSRYRCSAEGLAPVDFGPGNNRAELGGQPVSYSLEVVRVSGVAIPDYDRWAVGNSWKLVMRCGAADSRGRCASRLAVASRISTRWWPRKPWSPRQGALPPIGSRPASLPG